MPSTSTLISSFVVIAAAAMALVLWISQGEANEDGLLIAVFSPTATEREIMRAVTASDGVFVRSSLPETIVVAQSDSPGFADRLRSEGAWLTYGQSPFGPELAGCLALATAPFEPAELER
ncbi:MAG: hypothetical protein AAGH43_04090 [Pseudomonadota bacterium]